MFKIKKYLVFLLFVLFVKIKAQNELEIKGNLTFTNTPTSANISSFTFSPLLEIGYKLKNEYYFALKMGATYTRLERIGYSTDSRTDFANPIVTFGYINNKLSGISNLDMLLNIGIPLATFPGNIPQNRLSEFNYTNANNIYGWKESLSWTMNVIPISVALATNNKLYKNLNFNFVINPIYFISVNSRPDKQAISANLQLEYDFNNYIVNLGTNYYYSLQSIENDDKDSHYLYIGNSFIIGDYLLGAEFNLNLDNRKQNIKRINEYNYGILLKINKKLNL
ncbi:MAG TPA: hypothetical protein PL041_00560 [Melioribacteraceae bacterium]|nr:hypothetical protein [Melioribacteraceae bacterium]